METVSFIRKAVSNGWMQIGTPEPDLGWPGGTDWWDVTGDEAAAYVATALDRLGRRPLQPEIAWLGATPEGKCAMDAYEEAHPYN
jgi:hypothetical protein